MSFTGLMVLLAIGAAITILPQMLAARRGRRNLTSWILTMMGVGIIVGGLFRYYSPETFAPSPARVEGIAEGPFDLSSPLRIEYQLTEDGPWADISVGGPEFKADSIAKASVQEVARGLNDAARTARLDGETSQVIRASHVDGHVVVAAAAKGDSSYLRLRDGTANSLEMFGLSSDAAAGKGSATSVIRDLHTFLRDIFIRALRMMIVPIIFSSIVAGMLSLGSRGLGRIGLKTLLYYMSTSLLAIVVGLVLVNLIAPGDGAVITLEDKPAGFEETANQSTSEFLFSFFRNLIPTNPIKAMVDGQILQLIFFALFLGYFINRLPSPFRESLSTFFNGLFEVMLLIVRTLLWLAPLGVYAIFAKIIGETGPEAFIDLGWYALAVFLGLVVHACVTLPLMVRMVGGLSPWRHFKAMGPALLTAFSTSSSSATLPMTLRCVQERVGVSGRTSSFVLPLGATVNMDGTALYECVAAIFIAQVYITQGEMPPLTLAQQFLVVVTALAASIGAAGVPMAGMVMLGIILHALGLPLEGVGYVLAVDRLLDMCRTTVNVWSDSCGCAVIAKTEGEDQVLTKWPPPDLG